MFVSELVNRYSIKFYKGFHFSILPVIRPFEVDFLSVGLHELGQVLYLF